MKGMPWHWFKMLNEADPSLDWEKFKWVFFYRYENKDLGNLFMQLKMFQKIRLVDEFVEEFEMLASQILRILDD